MLRSVNPATEAVLAEFEPHTNDDVERALSAAADAANRQRLSNIEDRCRLIEAAATVLENKADEFAKLMTQEMGKTFASAKSEVEKCAWVCRYYAENGPRFLADTPYPSDAAQSFVRYLPLGPVLAVMPWNFPFWQVFRFAAPALVAGNVALLKHASNVPQSALAISDVFSEAGFDEGVFQTLLIGSDKVEQILTDDRVRAATLTGSEGAGRAVAALAGKHLKKTVLELGGSDPFIVMPSADLEAALDAAVTGRTMNNGQSCIAAKRFILHAEIYDAFLERLSTRFSELKVGDPMASDTDIGPLATADIRDELSQQVNDSVSAGARRVVGAEKMDGTGYFYRPGILADIPKDAPAYGEELFGPVALVFKADNLEQAVSIGNSTRFGLGSAIFSNDTSEQDYAATHLDAGATFVNAIVASDPRLPFGGVKASGYGRELADVGIREFVNQKTVSIA